MASIPQSGRGVRLKSQPRSLPHGDHFEVLAVNTPEPASDEILVRNRYTRAAGSLRMMISEGAESVEGVPFPAFRPGDLRAEERIGEVVSAPPDRGLVDDNLVRHCLEGRQFAEVPIRAGEVVAGDLPEIAAHLPHGWTAYAALTRVPEVRPGDTDFITSTAGSRQLIRAIGLVMGEDLAREGGMG